MVESVIAVTRNHLSRNLLCRVPFRGDCVLEFETFAEGFESLPGRTLEDYLRAQADNSGEEPPSHRLLPGGSLPGAITGPAVPAR